MCLAARSSGDGNKGVRDDASARGDEGKGECRNDDEEEKERRDRSTQGTSSGRQGDGNDSSVSSDIADHVTQKFRGHRNSQTVKVCVRFFLNSKAFFLSSGLPEAGQDSSF
jgi:hypothetical protein